MKKMLLASAFALFGTFAMTNESNNTEEAESLVSCFEVGFSCGGWGTYCFGDKASMETIIEDIRLG